MKLYIIFSIWILIAILAGASAAFTIRILQ